MQGVRCSAGRCRGRPPVSKSVGGWAGGTTAQAKPNPPLKEGARHSKTIRPGRVPGPLLFLGACRIHLALWASHKESPCGRGAEGTPQRARPSEEGWRRSECRFETSSLEPLRLVSVSPWLATALSQICPGSVTAPFGAPLVNVAKGRQLSHSRDICPLECYGLPLSLPRKPRKARRLQAGTRWVPGRDG